VQVQGKIRGAGVGQNQGYTSGYGGPPFFFSKKNTQQISKNIAHFGQEKK